ncbi:hypothetical protein D4R87_02425 [bacterium]|nr:MAG: hypothetical protein D4R87_02425 [bacterium]
MNKPYVKPLVLVIGFGVLILCALYFTGKYDEGMQAKMLQYKEDSYQMTFRARFKLDKGGADSPEEAYEGFKSAMLEEDLDKALSFVFVLKRDEYEYKIREYFKEGETYYSIVNALPINLQRDDEYDCSDYLCAIKKTVYYEGGRLENGVSYADRLSFAQTFNDKWQIESF